MYELEDDRYDTRIADEVEVLPVGGLWAMPELLPESRSNLSVEEDYEGTMKPTPVKVGMVKNVLSPRNRLIQDGLSLSPRSKKMVKKVQIVMCAKSVG